MSKRLTFLDENNVEKVVKSEMIYSDYNLITNGDAIKTGRKIDGKDEYIKRIYIDEFPNSTYMDVNTELNHSTVNIGVITGKAISPGQSLDIPFVSLSSGGIQVATQFTKNVISITTVSDRSSYSGYIDIPFTYKER